MLKDLWEKIKKWAKETALPWLKTAWIQIVNVFVVIFAYGKLDDAGMVGASALVGLWGFILLGYWIFWKFFGLDKVIKAYIKQQKEKKKK